MGDGGWIPAFAGMTGVLGEEGRREGAGPFDRLRVSGGLGWSQGTAYGGWRLDSGFRRNDGCVGGGGKSARPFDRLRVSGGDAVAPPLDSRLRGNDGYVGGREKRGTGGFQTRPYGFGLRVGLEGGGTLTPALSQDGRGGRDWGGWGLFFGGDDEGVFFLPAAEAGFHVGDVGVAHLDKCLPCQGSSAGTASMGDDAGVLVRDDFFDAAFDAPAGR